MPVKTTSTHLHLGSNHQGLGNDIVPCRCQLQDEAPLRCMKACIHSTSISDPWRHIHQALSTLRPHPHFTLNPKNVMRPLPKPWKLIHHVGKWMKPKGFEGGSCWIDQKSNIATDSHVSISIGDFVSTWDLQGNIWIMERIDSFNSQWMTVIPTKPDALLTSYILTKRLHLPSGFICQPQPYTPGRLTWNMSSWRLGRWYSFLNGWCIGSMLIFQGVNLSQPK